MTEPRLEEVADRVFAYVQPDGGWCLNNAGIAGGLVIDTAATEARARALRESAEEIARTRLVVNTHHHGDHTHGNFVFARDAPVIAHPLARTEMSRRGLALCEVWPDRAWGALKVALPTLTVADRLTVHAGSIRAEVLHPGPAHTTGDLVVWLPDHRVVFTGDLVLPGCAPFTLMGSVAGTLEAVARLRELDPLVVVGGHGPVAGPGALDETEAYLRRVQRLAAEGRAAGLTPLETALEAGHGEFDGLRDAERLVANLHRAYADADGVEPGTGLRSGPVFREMTAFNGGRHPVCRV
ncbi:MBL fold metallo-hydrolase [Actinomadura gamaensis]|uniref:MBL fold metallo-hydrolase n=1 Tax=Actinomadura gamaensis TaxID=1763541 RepID=A0ABV9TY27_9ACTN